MKKFLAIMLIAVIAVAGVFATMAENPTNVVLYYKVPDTFISKVGFKVAINSITPSDFADYATTVYAGTQVGAIDSGYVVIDIYDMSYCNSAEPKFSYVTITMPEAWIDKDNVATLAKFSEGSALALDDACDNAGLTTTGLDSGKISIAYNQDVVIDRNSADAKAVKVASATYNWAADPEVVVGTYTATFIVSYTAN